MSTWLLSFVLCLLVTGDRFNQNFQTRQRQVGIPMLYFPIFQWNECDDARIDCPRMQEVQILDFIPMGSGGEGLFRSNRGLYVSASYNDTQGRRVDLPPILIHDNSAMIRLINESGRVWLNVSSQPGILNLYIDPSITFESGAHFNVTKDTGCNVDCIETQAVPDSLLLGKRQIFLTIKPDVFYVGVTSTWNGWNSRSLTYAMWIDTKYFPDTYAKVTTPSQGLVSVLGTPETGFTFTVS